MSYRTALATLICLSFLLTACPSKKNAAPPQRPPAPVLAATSSQRDVPVIMRAIGTMEASESVTIKPQISGELTRVAFREGQDVQKGALLFQIDDRSYRAALKKAEAALARDRVVMENANANYERYRQLVKDGIVTQEQAEGYRTAAESAAANVGSDQAEIENARAQLSYCTITAPISGRLGVLAMDRGNVVKASETPLVTINKVTPINATFTIPEKELDMIKRQMAGGRVVLHAEVPGAAGASGALEKGHISFLDNSVDPATGTIKLKGTFDNPHKRLWPGQFVTVSISLDVKKNAVVVPSQAVQTGQQGQYLLVIKPDSTAELRQVSAGAASQGVTVIEKGLAVGEQVVIDGHVRVVPGAKVEIKQPEKPGGAASPAPVAGPAVEKK